MPGGVLPQIERPFQAIIGALPGLGQRRLDGVVQPGGLGQALEHVAEIAGRARVVGKHKVEGQGLRDGGVGNGPAERATSVLERVRIAAQPRDDLLLRLRPEGGVAALTTAKQEHAAQSRHEQETSRRVSPHSAIPLQRFSATHSVQCTSRGVPGCNTERPNRAGFEGARAAHDGGGLPCPIPPLWIPAFAGITRMASGVWRGRGAVSGGRWG